jgi:hypothetical protein
MYTKILQTLSLPKHVGMEPDTRVFTGSLGYLVIGTKHVFWLQIRHHLPEVDFSTFLDHVSSCLHRKYIGCWSLEHHTRVLITNSNSNSKIFYLKGTRVYFTIVHNNTNFFSIISVFPLFSNPQSQNIAQFTNPLSNFHRRNVTYIHSYTDCHS